MDDATAAGEAPVGEMPLGAGCLTARPVGTTRLWLVPLAVAHADEMAGVLADPALHEFVGGAPLSPDALRTRYERLVAGSPDPARSWCNWVIRLRDTDHLAGTVQATVTDVPPVDAPPTGQSSTVTSATIRAPSREAEIAWVVGTPWQGRGIAREAARALAEWLRERGVEVVVAHVHPDHRASASVAAAAGLAPTEQWVDGEIRWERREAPPKTPPRDL